MTKSDIQNMLETVPESIENLEFLQTRDFQEVYFDFHNSNSALYKLQDTIQALIDIGSYIIAQLGLKKPGFNGEIIEILMNSGLINDENRERYIRVLKFRNRLEHLYRNFDIDIFDEMICKDINDVRIIYEKFYKIIKENED